MGILQEFDAPETQHHYAGGDGFDDHATRARAEVGVNVRRAPRMSADSGRVGALPGEVSSEPREHTRVELALAPTHGIPQYAKPAAPIDPAQAALAAVNAALASLEAALAQLGTILAQR